MRVTSADTARVERTAACGLGEPGVFLVWGPLMIGGTYFVATGTVPGWVWIASLPYAILVTTAVRSMGAGVSKIVTSALVIAQTSAARVDQETIDRVLAKEQAEVARQELLGRGIEASEITVFDERDGGTFFGFSDPDGNSWAVQELKVRGEKPLIPLDHRGRFGA